MSKRSSDDFDHDDTDELPVLLDPVGLEDAELLESAAQPSLPPAPSVEAAAQPLAPERDAASSQALLSDAARPDEQIPALEAQIGVLTDSMRDLENRLIEKDRRLEELREMLSAVRRSADDSGATQKRLATQLAVRDARIAELTATIERLEQAATVATAEIERQRQLAEARNSEAEALRRELETQPEPQPAAAPAPAPAPAGPDEQLTENYATLKSYVAARRAWWDEMQESNARLAARVTGLEEELAASAKGLAAAEAFASRESSRAVGLRAELVDYARRVDELERQLRLLRAQPEAANGAGADEHALDAPTASAPSATAADAGFGDASRQPPPGIIEAVEAISPAVEAIAQLEAEVEYKRQQVAAQLVELHARELQLRAATSAIGELRGELDASRSNVARLEQAVVDKDRALEARDARIAALHEELKQRIAAAERRTAADLAPPALANAGRRDGLHEAAADSASTPALICLTGDAPKRFALTKSTVTVGRGPHCDLQIVTHFVSREHARLTLSGGATLIEDLGSRNGVFVNSVRVDRRRLQQGDLVTIGETQFRFVESMAH
ncbi:MAG TPA: FHA domain-containing protein [Gammaproteobacteria bacterium]|nr:FHA domain-containing protein [Gammaproteobacteria bacterium]